MAVDVRAAILSIYYHAYAASHGLTPPPDMPSLEEAAVALHDAAVGGGRYESRRRHAIARLSAAGVDLHLAALVTLGAPIDDIRAEIKAHPGLDEPHQQMLVDDLLNRLYGPAMPGCEWKNLLTIVEPGVGGRGSKVTVTLLMKKTLEELAVVMDPQSWRNGNDFFENSYIAEKVGDEYPVDENHDARPNPDPPSAGSRWSNMLFEHFKLHMQGMEISWFRNFLWIDARPEEHKVQYCLARPIQSRVGYLEPEDGIRGGIETDGGHTVARSADDGWVSLEAVKTIKFSNRAAYPGMDMDAWAKVLLGAMGGETADSACCRGDGYLRPLLVP